MYYSYSNLQMREADERTIRGGTSQETLMARAGSVLANVVRSACQKMQVDTPLFVCGGGNNGGDGFVAAELLRRQGFNSAVLCMAKKFSSACARERERFGGEIYEREVRMRCPIVVDCVFGTGLNRPPEGEYRAMIEWIVRNGGYVISADIPSGLSDGGVAYFPHVTAGETVCFGQWKHALLLESGRDIAGKVTLADIGISAEGGAQVWEDSDVNAFFPKRKNNCHKGSFGTASIVGGRGNASGAIFLAAGASLKSGAGYTKLYLDGELYPFAIGKLPACVLKKLEKIDGELLSSDCIAIGMGAGVSEGLYELICALLASYRGMLLLDADALNTLAKFGLQPLRKKACKVVLTPHLKEFCRLSGLSLEEVKSDMVGTCKAFACDMGVTVLLKSNSSVISDGERVAINVEGSPTLAKGGSGDVLSGFLAGTLARGVSPLEACCVSSYLLGRSGKLAASEMGEYSPDGTDVISYLPKAILSLTQGNNRIV